MSQIANHIQRTLEIFIHVLVRQQQLHIDGISFYLEYDIYSKNVAIGQFASIRHEHILTRFLLEYLHQIILLHFADEVIECQWVIQRCLLLKSALIGS